ncbi:MAG: hypothetical protein K0R31_1376, partial [Clostridiales bacterium]|nr:hypothetical protein [Clostridiales bacterium]
MTLYPRIIENFIFTQQSLSTFEKCPMKFKLRYIDKLRWDGLNAEAVKRRVEFGNDFHLLARRYFLGIDSGLDLFTGENDELNCSMENLEEAFMLDKDSKYLPEYKLRFINSEFRLE